MRMLRLSLILLTASLLTTLSAVAQSLSHLQDIAITGTITESIDKELISKVVRITNENVRRLLGFADLKPSNSAFFASYESGVTNIVLADKTGTTIYAKLYSLDNSGSTYATASRNRYQTFTSTGVFADQFAGSALTKTRNARQNGVYILTFTSSIVGGGTFEAKPAIIRLTFRASYPAMN